MINVAPEVDVACALQFEMAKQRAPNFVYARDMQDYSFGRKGGAEVLESHDLPNADPLVMLDIGAGRGTFLSEVQDHTLRSIRPIGLTAAATTMPVSPARNKIHWEYGDIQRPSTWTPPDVLRPGTVDLAVSAMTFRHLVDPLRALHNAIQLLKPEGELFVDMIPVVLPIEDSDRLAEMVREELRPYEGEHGVKYKLAGNIRSLTTLFLQEAHFHSQVSPPAFEGIVPRMVPTMRQLVVYDFADKAA